MSTAPITAREGERRHVTVMFADISGFTAISRTMDPEDVTDLMNACFGVLEQAVVEHGGHVDKYIGDCVMALFGAPTALEDGPRQAINAAICILQRIRDFAVSRGLGDRIGAHVGINTGLVVYSDVGGDRSRDTTAMGDTVNVASRLRDVSSTGSILVSPQTHRETEYDFRFRHVTGLKLKGVENFGDAWEVLSRQTQLHRHRGLEPGDRIPMVGREDAVAKLSAVLGALEAGRGAVVAIAGEAGIGKSRLIREMRRSGMPPGTVVADGCALRVGQSLPLYPFVSLLRSWAGIDVATSEPDARRRMIGSIEAVLGAERAAEIHPFLATIAGATMSAEDSRRLEGIDSEGMQILVARSLEDLFEGICRSNPLVLVLEDLHWADRSTIDLLLRLMPLARRQRVLFLLAFRLDDGEASVALEAALKGQLADVSSEIILQPLDAKAAGALLRAMIQFDPRPDRTRREIFERTEGNPFFIEELLRSLIDLGAIQSTDEGLRVVDDIAEMRVPGTIQELVMDRVDRLPPEEREVLQSASVISRSFALSLLDGVVPDPDVVPEAIEHQLRMGLLENALAPSDDDYSFKHALAHETVYRSILKRRRRELHRLVGHRIEDLHRDRLRDFYAVLAWHFSTAEDWEKASFYLLKAGDDAARSAASHEALRYFSEAARIYDELHAANPDPRSRAALEKRIGLACLNKGDLPAALDHLDRALAMLGHSVPKTPFEVVQRSAADVAAILWRLYARGAAPARRKPPEEIVEITELLFHKGKAQSTTAPQGYVTSMLPAIRAVLSWDFRGVEHACGVYSAGATLFAWSGISFRIARRLSKAGSAFVRNVPDAVIHETMKYVARYLEGQWQDEFALDPDLVSTGLRYGEFWEVNTYLGMQCERLVHQGRYVEAASVIEEIEQLSSHYGYDFARTNYCAMRAFLLLEARRLADARAAADRYYDACNEEALNLLALATRARVQVLSGELADAGATIEQAEALARTVGQQAAAYHLSPLRLARFAFTVESLESAADGGARELRRAARASRRAALAIVPKIARDRPECFRLAARLAWHAGKRLSAHRWWERAIREAERLGARPELARAMRECGERLDASDSRSRVAGRSGSELLAEATRMEAELAAEWSRLAPERWPAS